VPKYKINTNKTFCLCDLKTRHVGQTDSEKYKIEQERLHINTMLYELCQLMFGFYHLMCKMPVCDKVQCQKGGIMLLDVNLR